MKHLLIVLSVLMTANLNVYAKEGAEGVGGGDECERKIKHVSAQLQDWIIRGGHKQLKFPDNIDAATYAFKMTMVIQGITSAACVSEGDSGYPVEVDGVPKTCRFEVSKSNARQKVAINCDYNKFMNLDEESQFRLLHHEFAGIAGLEKPKGADSNYDISNELIVHNHKMNVCGIDPYSQKEDISTGLAFYKGTASRQEAFQSLIQFLGSGDFRHLKDFDQYESLVVLVEGKKWSKDKCSINYKPLDVFLNETDVFSASNQYIVTCKHQVSSRDQLIRICDQLHTCMANSALRSDRLTATNAKQALENLSCMEL